MAELTAKVRWYEEQFHFNQQKRFGTSSEKTPENQLALELFNEAEKEGDPEVPEPAVESITYCVNQWKHLEAFLLDGRLERSERSIKPFVIGRKNWIFSNTPRGAKGSVIMYSLVETAKENGLSPYHYLRY